MKRFKGTKGMLILIILVCGVIGYYFYISNKTEDNNSVAEETVEITAVQNVLLRNLEIDYPPTPKEVVKYFAEITKCFYSENYTDEELVQLAVKIQQIYDDELVAAKEQETYLEDLKADIKDFKLEKRVITGYYTSSSTDVEEFTEDGYDWARLYVTFYITKGKNVNEKSRERILLRKDAEGHWKIYGWDLVD